MTKESRLSTIREIARRVAARHAGEGGTFRPADIPAELTQAERKAAQE